MRRKWENWKHFFLKKSRQNAQKTHFFCKIVTLMISTQKPGEFRGMGPTCHGSTFYEEHFGGCHYRVPSRALPLFPVFVNLITLYYPVQRFCSLRPNRWSYNNVTPQFWKLLDRGFQKCAVCCCRSMLWRATSIQSRGSYFFKLLKIFQNIEKNVWWGYSNGPKKVDSHGFQV